MIPLQTAAPHPVSHILFAPDGSTVAAAQPHYGVTLLERATGQTLAVCVTMQTAGLSGLTFCDEGKYLAVSHAKGLEVFDAATGARVAMSHYRVYRNLRLARSGADVLGANDSGVRVVWKPGPTGGISFGQRLVSRLESIDVLSADGHLAMLGGSHFHEVLFDLDSHRTVTRIDREERHGRTVAGFCPLGRRFALNNGEVIDVYDAGTPPEEDEDEQSADTPLVQRDNVAPKPHTRLAPVFTLKPDKASEAGAWYPPFALLADGRGLLVKRPRNRVQLWDAPTGTLLNEWSWRFEWVTCVAVSHDGTTAVAGGRFGRLLLWDLE